MSSEPTEDQRIALASMHALALGVIRAKDARAHRKRLADLADYAPDPVVLGDEDPRSDAQLAKGISHAPAARHFAARLRGVVTGAGAHADTARAEVCALTWAALEGEGVARKELDARALRAFDAVRADLEQDIVRLGDAPITPEGDAVRRWGSVRALELNAFVAAFTRDGTHPRATRATSEGEDAGALRFVMAVSQAAMSLARESEPEAGLVEDARRTEAAVCALLAQLVITARP